MKREGALALACVLFESIWACGANTDPQAGDSSTGGADSRSSGGSGGRSGPAGGTNGSDGSAATGAGGGVVAQGGSTAGGGSAGGAGAKAATGGRAATGGEVGWGGQEASAGGSAGLATNLGGSGGAAGLKDASAEAAGLRNTDILVPSQGALLGLYYDDRSIADTTTKLGRQVPVHLTYYEWADDWTETITAADFAAGRIPFVNWEPFTATLDEIGGGAHDAMLHTRARSAKNLGKLFLDFGAEMNGNWSPWGGEKNGSSSAKYIAAYRHIHDVFVAEGATNVVWLWCPNVTDVPDANWNHAMNYYPGDDYVDWTCVDGYNWGTSQSDSTWQTFHDVFETIYPNLAAKGKPILVGEMASSELGGDKAGWIDAIVPTLRADFPMIKGMVWFDVNKETDWRIRSSTTSETAFVRMATDGYFNP
jgi:hypothetical protein